MAVITLSRQLGSGDIPIAQEISKQFSCRIIDKEVIVQAAQLAHVTESEIEEFDQEHFDRMKILFKDMRFLAPGNTMTYPVIVGGFMEPYWFSTNAPDSEILDESKYLQLTQTVIQKLAEEGNVLLMGRGSCILLKDFPEIFHLRIVAPLEQRTPRVMEMFKIEKKRAEELIHQRDKASADYVKYYYHADWSDPYLYHMIYNTGKTLLNLAIENILGQLKIFFK